MVILNFLIYLMYIFLNNVSLFVEELMTIPEDVCRKTEVASEESICKTEPAQLEEESEIEEEVVEEVIIPRSPKMDTAGKPIGRLFERNNQIPATTKEKE